MELINKKEFVKAALNKNSETFVVYIAALKTLLAKMSIYHIQKTQIVILQYNKALIKILPKYLYFADIFLFELIIELLKNKVINKYTIELKKDKPLLDDQCIA